MTSASRMKRSVRLLSFRADAIVSRATRVWLAYSRDSPDERRVIKDIWARENAKSETQIRGNLTSRIRETQDENERARDLGLYERYFITHVPDLSGPVFADTSNLPVSTLQFVAGHILADDDIKGALDHRTIVPSPKPEKYTHLGSQPDAYPSMMTEAYTSRRPKPPASLYKPRVHYREVFMQECESYECLKSVPVMCQALYDCTKVWFRAS